MDKIAEYGSVLCHYTKSSTAFEDILFDRRLRLSPYRLMRDPTEYPDWLFGAAFFPDNFESRDDEGKTYTAAHQALNSIKWETKLLALTEDALDYKERGFHEELFGRGWARARMWEHYAENHREVCLVFDRAGLDGELKAGLAAAGATAIYDGAVRYTHAGVAATTGARTFHLDNFKTKPSAEAAAEHLQRHYRDLFLLKTLDWASEHEYRYLASSPGSDYLYVPFRESLRAVVVGERFPLWQASGVLEICEQAEVDAYRLKWLHEGPFPVPLRPGSLFEEEVEWRAEKQRRAGQPLPPPVSE